MEIIFQKYCDLVLDQPIRIILLKKLLEGEKSGQELFNHLQKQLERDFTHNVLYHNLNRLEETGLIIVRKDWREKFVSIKTEYFDLIKKYLQK